MENDEPASTRIPAGEREGATRAEPVPFGDEVTTPNWRLRVIDLLRGQSALDAIEIAPNDLVTAIPNPELVAVEIEVASTPDAPGTRDVNWQSFALTGDLRVRHDALNLRGLPGILDASLDPGETTTGYVTFIVPRGEGNLILHFVPVSLLIEADRVYLAVEPGARIAGPGDALPQVDPQSGVTPESPAAPGNWVSNGNLAVRILTVLRDSEAERFIINELGGGEGETPPALEHVLLEIAVAYVGAEGEDDFSRISSRAFELFGSPSATIDEQFTGPLILDAHLYPGGATSGWLPLLVPAGETPVLVLRGAPDEEARFLAIE